jgi:FtsZ-binding cell division protein ZapB
MMTERKGVQTAMLAAAEKRVQNAIATYDIQIEELKNGMENMHRKKENVQKARENLKKAQVKKQKAQDYTGCFSLYRSGHIPFRRNRISVLDIIQAEKLIAHASIQFDSAQRSMKSAEEAVEIAKLVWKAAWEAVESAAGLDSAQDHRLKCTSKRLQLASYDIRVIANTIPIPWNQCLWEVDSKRSQDLRKKAADHYGDCEITENMEIVATCRLTGVRGEPNVIAIAHILPRNAAEHFLLQCDMNDVDHPRNTIFLCKNIEQAFNDQKLCFLMDEFTGNLILKILHNGTKDDVLFPGAPETIGLYDGKPMRFMEKEVPFTKALSLHAQTAYAMAKEKNWIEREVPDPIMYGSPVSFDTITFTGLWEI